MWTATRNSTTARTDEDVAMAYVNYGSYAERKDARKALLDAIRTELNHSVNGTSNDLQC